MIKVDQTLHDDCFRACLASLLELPIDEVPHFVRKYGNRKVGWVTYLRNWLAKRGLTVIIIGANDRNWNTLPNILHIVCGFSNIKNWECYDDLIDQKLNERVHAVIAKGNKLIFDPNHKQRNFFLNNELVKRYFILPLDISKWSISESPSE